MCNENQPDTQASDCDFTGQKTKKGEGCVMKTNQITKPPTVILSVKRPKKGKGYGSWCVANQKDGFFN